MAGRPRPGWWIAAALVLFVALSTIAPALLSGKILSSADLLAQRDPVFQGPLSGLEGANPFRFDSAFVFEPDLMEARWQLRSGRLPTWMAEVGGGRPLLASQQHAVFYPLTLLAVVGPIDRAAAVILMLKILLAGLGMLLLCRSLGMSAPSGALAAIAFCGSAYLTSWLQHPHSNVFLLLPWLLLAAHHVVRRDTDWGPTAFLGLLGGLALLGGHPPSAILCLGLTAAYLASSAIRPRLADGTLSTRALAGRLAVSGVIALGLGAVMILPFLGALSQAIQLERGAVGGPIEGLISVVAPDFWGDPSGRAATDGPLNYAERSMFIGIAALTFALAGAATVRSRQGRFFVIATAVCMLLAFRIPPISTGLSAIGADDVINFQRVVVLIVFCLSVLAGYGLDGVLGRDVHARRVSLVAACALLAGCAIAALLMARTVTRLLADVANGFVGETPAVAADLASAALGRSALISAGLLVLLLALDRVARGRRLAVVAVLLALVGAELLTTNHGYYRFLDPDIATPGPPEAAQAIRSSDPLDRFTSQGLLGPNLALRYGLYDARVHDHPTVRRYSRLWKSLVPSSSTIRTEFLDLDEQSTKLLDLFSVRRVLFHGDSEPTTAFVRARPTGASGTIVAENDGALPRAFLATSWHPSSGPDDALLQVTALGREQLRRRPVIEDASPSTAVPAEPIAQDVTRYEDEEVEVAVDAPRSGYLILTDIFYPGWVAEIDGRRTPILPANAAFRAVAVPPGRHTVRFSYRPSSATVGLGLTLGALVGLSLIAIAPIRRRLAVLARLPPPDLPSWAHDVRPLATARIALTRMEGRLREVAGGDTQDPRHRPGPASEAGPAPTSSVRKHGRIALILVAAATGAVLGASLHPLPQDRFQADAVVVIRPDVTETSPEIGHRSFSEAVELPQVAEAATKEGQSGVEAAEVPDRVGVIGDPRSRIVRVRARGESFPQAMALADAVAVQAVAFLRRAGSANLVESNLRTTYGFEDGREGWTEGSVFSIASDMLRQEQGEARRGDGKLFFACSETRPGCGPGVNIARPFDPETTYVAHAFVRSSDEQRNLRLVLGSGSLDVATGEPVRVNEDDYRRLTVSWTPRRATSDATLAIQTTDGDAVEASVDSVVVVDQTDGAVDDDAAERSASVQEELRARRAAAADRYVNVGDAASTGVLESATWRWALLGAALGVLAVCGGLALAAAARRRQ